MCYSPGAKYVFLDGRGLAIHAWSHSTASPDFYLCEGVDIGTQKTDSILNAPRAGVFNVVVCEGLFDSICTKKEVL